MIIGKDWCCFCCCGVVAAAGFAVVVGFAAAAAGFAAAGFFACFGGIGQDSNYDCANCLKLELFVCHDGVVDCSRHGWLDGKGGG